MEKRIITHCLLSALLTVLLPAQQRELVRPPTKQIISDHLKRKVEALDPGDSLNIWVFFTDKGIFSDTQLEKSLRSLEKGYNRRALRRRSKSREYNLGIKDLAVKNDYCRAVVELGARLRMQSKWFNAVSVRTVPEVISKISALPYVHHLELVHSYRRTPSEILPDCFEPPRSPGINTGQYSHTFRQLDMINVIAAHEAGYYGQGVNILLLDTGFFLGHEALRNCTVVAQWDFIQGDGITANEEGDAETQHYHGTYVLSVIGGYQPNTLIGVAPQANFYLAKTENVATELQIEEDYYVAGLEWGDSLGVDVASSSLGYYDWYTFADMDGETALTTLAVEAAIDRGIVCVTAAGNENGLDWNHIIAPADARRVFSVGAVDSTEKIFSRSSRGPTYDGRIKPDVVAQGVLTYCASPDNDDTYRRASGTSLSTPLVAGVAALLLSANPDWTPAMIREALLLTADNARFPNNIYGWGLVDALVALNYDYDNFRPGDVDWDGRQTVLDVIKIRRYILGREHIHEFEFRAADMNQDRHLDILDIVQLIHQILGV